MRRWIALLLIVGMVSCAVESGSVASGVDKAGAIEAARREVQTREDWAGRAKYSATPTEDGWVVFAVRVGDRPPNPNDPVLREPNVMVTVDPQGKVTSYGWGHYTK